MPTVATYGGDYTNDRIDCPMSGKSLIRAAIQVAARRRRDQRIVPYAVAPATST